MLVRALSADQGLWRVPRNCGYNVKRLFSRRVLDFLQTVIQIIAEYHGRNSDLIVIDVVGKIFHLGKLLPERVT